MIDMRRRRRKLFRPKRHSRIRRSSDKIISGVLSVLGVIVLVFVGYSALGPISDYLKAHSEREKVPVWTPEDTVTSVTAPAVTEAPEPAQTEDTRPIRVPDDAAFSAAKGYKRLSTADMKDSTSLGAACEKAVREGYFGVLLPMKTKGGVYWYKTEDTLVSLAEKNPVRGSMTAAEAGDICRGYGLSPAAQVSILTDNNRYGEDRIGVYRTEDDLVWLDDLYDNGGKPWICPYDDDAVRFLCDMVVELGEAGFKKIVCEDMSFPSFRESDLDYLGYHLSPDSDRHTYLTSLAKKLTNSARSAGADTLFCFWSYEIMSRSAECFVPEELAGCTLIVRTNAMTDLSEYFPPDYKRAGDTEKLEQLYENLSSLSGGLTVYPMIDGYLASRVDLEQLCRTVGTEEYFTET